MNSFDDPEASFSISGTDMFAYSDYVRDCILQKKDYKLFCDWYKETHNVVVPLYLQKTLNKTLAPKKK